MISDIIVKWLEKLVNRKTNSNVLRQAVQTIDNASLHALTSRYWWRTPCHSHQVKLGFPNLLDNCYIRYEAWIPQNVEGHIKNYVTEKRSSNLFKLLNIVLTHPKICVKFVLKYCKSILWTCWAFLTNNICPYTLRFSKSLFWFLTSRP